MQSKVGVFQGLIQADFQGGDHFLFIQEHKQLPNMCSFSHLTSQTNLAVIRTSCHSVLHAHSTVMIPHRNRKFSPSPVYSILRVYLHIGHPIEENQQHASRFLFFTFFIYLFFFQNKPD